MYVIEASFALAEQHPMTYWWPLLCEAMRCQGLGYTNPHYLPRQVGNYIYHYAVDRAIMHYDVDIDSKDEYSFRQLWDDLHAEKCRGVDVTFWSAVQPDLGPEVESEPELVLDGRIHQETEIQAITLSCWLTYLGYGLTPEADTREATRRVHRWLDVIREIYRLCGPCTAELTHERWGVDYRMGTIGKPLVLEWEASPTQFGVYEGEIIQERLPDGAMLSVVNPLRLSWRGDALPIRLRDGEVDQE